MLHKLAPLVNARFRRLQFLLLPATWFALVMLVFVPDKTFVFGPGFYQPYYPREIYKFLETQVPAQNLFNDMRYGGSMQWWLYPKFKPYIDGRGDAYSVEFWKTEYLPVLKVEPEWETILQRHDVQGVLLPIPPERRIPRLAETLRSHADWALVAYNDHTLLFLRRNATNEPVIARHEFKLIWPGDWSFAALNNPETRTNAANEAKRALELSPESLFALTANAGACFTQEQFAEAAVTLHDIISRHEAGENYWRDYGFALFRVGEMKEADRVFASMIRKKMLPAFASFMRHHIALQEGRPAEARKLLDDALKLEPANQQFLDALKRLNAPPQ
jgi:pentatricopeptide repeat protein